MCSFASAIPWCCRPQLLPPLPLLLALLHVEEASAKRFFVETYVNHHLETQVTPT